jgi:flagellar assembly protein FliH
MSLSNLIKFDGYVALDDTKVVDSLQNLLRKARRESKPRVHSDEEAAARQQELDRMYEMKDKIMQDAEEFAEATVRRATEEADLLKSQACEEIESWWQERRENDEQTVSEARDQGHTLGYQEGILKADEVVRAEYRQMIEEARSVLEHSYRIKRQIIQEAEPFLIELSTAIAEKIIQHQLTVSPEWVAELARGVLARKREKGIVTLCVTPGHFSFFQEMREELLMSLDSQAELEIVPDATVTDYGCVIRSEYGSVDARIDTQLNEIKSVLLQLAAGNEDRENDE